ncbi:DUF7260 family protein [Halostella litorea]|uniref:DUF7260 family protein n=1 Tax=Halostella litorea TaxID=2528831 RepID=UPI001092EAE8|nr:hypothetical protein [Halostella litorea]
MGVESGLDRARSRVREERERVAAERRAYDRFRDAVESVPAAPVDRRGSAAAGGVVPAAASGGERPGRSRCRRVREAFAETVRPHSVADVEGDESLLATLRAEFGDAVALALAPDTDNEFTPRLRETVRSKAAARRRTLATMADALDREADSVRSARRGLSSAIERLRSADARSPADLGFPALRRRHEALADHRRTCEAVAVDRQETLRSATDGGHGSELAHLALVEYLYQEFAETHPVLSAVARLDDALADRQRRLRARLVRRV